MDEIFADRRPRHGAARRRPCRHTARRARPTRGELVQMMVGREIDNLFPKIVRADRRAGAGGARSRAPADDQGRQPRRCAPARSSASPASSAPDAANWRRPFSASRPRESGEIRLAGASGRDSTRRSSARALGIAYVPEDRGVQGLVRPMSVLHNFSLAALASLSRAGFIDRAAERRLAEEGVARFSVKTSSLERDRGAALRRQPAEDRARQMARQQSQAAHPRRADARHRRRRQGRDPSPDGRTRRARGVAILMISSELPEVLGMSDRVLVMREGRLVAEFDRARRDPRGGRRGDDGRRRRSGEGGVSAIALARPQVARD